MAAALLTSAGPAFAARPVVLSQLRQQVRRTKRVLDTKTRLEDYHASPYHPAAIVERIHALESESAWAALCAELALLPDDELELFEDEIRKPDHLGHLPCSAALLGRTAAFWRAAAQRLAEAHPLAAAGGRQPPPLASVAVPIDVSHDHVFFDGQLEADQIALTFDDGPHATRTPRILKILADAGVRATFFEIGRNAAAHPELTRQVAAAGHTVGSHTFSHPNLPRLPEAHAESEIDSGDASVSLAMGLRAGQLPFFRFPYGARTATQLGFVQRRGNTTFFWNMDAQDWKIRDPHRLFLNVLHELDRAGHGIILFHDIQEQTVIVLPHVLDELRARGLRTVVFVARQP